MKYAFLILAHTDPNQLSALVKALDDWQFDIYIHLDAKANMNQFLQVCEFANKSEVKFLEKRYDVKWGDITMVKAMVELYTFASKKGEYDRYTMLSGLDFPLKSTTEIITFFESNKNVELIMGNPLSSDEAKKVTSYNFMEINNRYLRYILRKTIGRIKLKPPYITINGRKCDVYFAPQWHSLSKECVNYILSTIETDPQILRYFRHSYAPDELLIPTMVFNSPYSDNTLKRSFPIGTHYNNKCAIHHINYDPIVQVFTVENYDDLIASDKLFCRKLCTGISDSLLKKIIDRIDLNKL